MDKPQYDTNQKDRTPLLHYQGVYQTLKAEDISQRCAIPFDPEQSAFTLRLMGSEYRADFPRFELRDPSGAIVQSVAEHILVLRYLCEGSHTAFGGKQLSYQEIPWGTVYYRNFEGRCLKRFAYTFGNDIPGFKRLMEGAAEQLRATPFGRADAGYRFEFLSGLYISVLLWGADEEFPPSAQFLFDDTFVTAFTAEDIAVAGEVVIARLKDLRRGV